MEFAVQNLEEVAATVEQRIAESRKRIFDLEVQTGQPFEYEQRLIVLSQRQDEIEEALDLNKGQAASQLDATADEENEGNPGESADEQDSTENASVENACA